jgi:hypothetical protein
MGGFAVDCPAPYISGAEVAPALSATHQHHEYLSQAFFGAVASTASLVAQIMILA